MTMTSQANNDQTPTGSKSGTGIQPPTWFSETRKKHPSTTGKTIFILLRLLDLPWQYYLLTSNLGVRTLIRIGLIPANPTTNNISAQTPYHYLLLLLAIGSAAKQIFWVARIADTAFHLPLATGVAGYNTLLNTINTLLAIRTLISRQPGDQSRGFLTSSLSALVLGCFLYAAGLWVEWYSELQRKRFKDDARKEGKPYSGGLFGYARNINYGGYTLWRTGYALICGGWVWGAVMAAWLAGDFCGRAIPSLDAYCEGRYGEQWREVRRKVPYRLLPWIY